MKYKYPEKITFSNHPTPIYPLKKFFKKNSKYNIWIKRDDLTGLELSGNKVRKLEYILADVKGSNSYHVVTCGGIQSNHCRTTAFIASQLSYECTLFLKGELPVVPTGNLLFNKILNAKIKNVSSEEYQNIDDIMHEYANENPTNTYVIPEGGSNEIGVWGYIECFFEILKQIQQKNIKINTIVVPTGSGGTHAGLLIGKYFANSDIDIVSINVCDSSDYFVNKILNIVKKFSLKNKVSLNILSNDVKIIDGFVGAGYGLVTDKEISFIKKFAQTEAIIIDPVYTAKALIGMNTLIENDTLPGKNILFIHTGGIFGLFAINDKFIGEE